MLVCCDDVLLLGAAALGRQADLSVFAMLAGNHTRNAPLQQSATWGGDAWSSWRASGRTWRWQSTCPLPQRCCASRTRHVLQLTPPRCSITRPVMSAQRERELRAKVVGPFALVRSAHGQQQFLSLSVLAAWFRHIDR